MRTVTETPVSGRLPRFEIAAWWALGAVAGVTGRGDPARPFDLGLGGDQPVRTVLERWRDLRSAVAGFDGLVVARQVHGTRVLWHDHGSGFVIFEGADGHATRRAGLLLAVSLADCIPIYVFDPVAKAIALLHSGWKGTANRILEGGIAELVRGAGSNPSDLLVHCGVGICGPCYEVGSEVATACGRPAPGQSLLDLRAVIAEQAAGLGVKAVTVSTYCSAHDRGSFFSHRGSGGTDGRMVAYLGLR